MSIAMVWAIPPVMYPRLRDGLDYPQWTGEQNDIYCREDAVRLGLFVGGFTGSYHLISGALHRWQGHVSPAHNCMAAGTAAGAPSTA